MMPWRTLIYKFLDATIDDLFNIAMSAPTLTTLMHLSDDIVFIILMIQRYIYSTDSSRTERGYIEANAKNTLQPPPPVDAVEVEDKKEK